MLPLAVFLWGAAFEALEEAGEGGGVGEAEAVGNMGDGKGGCLQQPGGFHQQHLVDVVGDGAPTHLTDDAREIGGGDAELGGIEGDVAMLDEMPR